MEYITNMELEQVFGKYPFARDWLDEYEFDYSEDLSIRENIMKQEGEFYRNLGISREKFLENFNSFIQSMEDFLTEKHARVEQVTLFAGRNKDGKKEKFERIDLKKGTIAAIVGPTGSGKSRLLADIEWGADGDTPTGRRVFLDGAPKPRESVGRTKKKWVAQLSQNMNFVIDLSVEQFLEMHAQCWMTEDSKGAVQKAFEMANELAGEPFFRNTHITSLSGGQSRALMIADCAILSTAPVVLIDELENAGINRRKALSLLTGENKIVLIATHDPALALLADFRIIIQNGGIVAVMEKNEQELGVLREAERLDALLQSWRDNLRHGKRLETGHFINT